MLIFTYSVDDALLGAFDGEAQALVAAAAAGSEVLFFAADGSALRRSDLPGGGAYLRPWASCGSCSLPQVMPLVRGMHPESVIDSLAAVEALLKA
jgi:hypothetical protein